MLVNWLDQMILKVYSSFDNSMMLWFYDSFMVGVKYITNVLQWNQAFSFCNSNLLSLNCSESNLPDSPTPKQKSCHALGISYVCLYKYTEKKIFILT